MRVHSLVDIYRQLNEQSTEVTFKDKRGRNFVNDSINNINQELSTPNLTGLQIENLQEELQEMQIRKDDLEEYIDQGTTIRARQEQDMNGKGPGKILLKCEERLGQQKYMSSIVEKNLDGDIISTIKGQKEVEGKMADYWEKNL